VTAIRAGVTRREVAAAVLPTVVLWGTLSAAQAWRAPLLVAGSAAAAIGVLAHRRGRNARRDDLRLRDPLTGLLNRAGAAAVYDGLVADGGSATLLVASITDFGEVNDAVGAAAGDVLLAAVAARLADVVGGSVARTGTNEFVVLLPGDDRREAELVATRVLDAAHTAPFAAGDACVVLEWSVGGALSSDVEGGFEHVIGRADLARLRAVARHKGFEIHEAGRYRIGDARLSMLAQLRTALDEGQFCVRYQPKARASDGRVVGVEALVRWDHPVNGLVGPDAFMPLLQHSGLSRALTTAVLAEAMHQVARWREAGHELTLAVNLTSRDLQDHGFPAAVAAALSRHPGAASWVQLEVTETTVVGEDTRTTETLEALAALGVKLAIDDFGAGATSLEWLRRLPIAEVKLDKGFISAMAGSFVDSAIVRAVVDLAHRLRLTVVAEGVEDPQTWRELAHMGCDIIQGYQLCPPLAGAELGSWLDRVSSPLVGVPA
jgi:diguanylate cyclase (GGDEF)-like protein